MKIFKLGNTVWFTNLKKPTNKKKLILTKKYNPSEYPKYENYNAINVNKIKDIPKDYLGYMGVPLTFLRYINNDFKIIGIANSARWIGDFPCFTIINGNKVYNRIIIKQNKNEN